ncbi:zinc finger and BTB domain-containing protein 7C [Protopterus annectens]|uniref:zinc finger and BTB domain-containing protein 7C n=1 Tax=Protopterus annectens TaxID=7888 RepID=UPI001CF9D571|nr:zinc finger and BTB domain-containing protein 7C [Protopterus annectens]XP_043937721.1 zinc finger and BTB domain-containing protein 7C [Protopterus annectens]
MHLHNYRGQDKSLLHTVLNSNDQQGITHVRKRAADGNMASGGDYDLIGIPFPNHSSEVLCHLNEQRRDGLFCDVILIVQDQDYRTHRSVLAACSKYFKKLFTTGTLEDQPNVYEIDFVTPEALSAILEFAYTSTLTITASNVKNILSAAQMLEIQCVINVCLEIMESNGDLDEEDEEEDAEVEDFQKGEEHFGEENVETEVVDKSQQKSSPSQHKDETPAHVNKDFESHCPENNSSSHLGTLRDFSIESLLRESLYPKVNIPDRIAVLPPFGNGFFPHMWNGDFGAFSQVPEQDVDTGPLDLVIKKGKIKEEEKETIPSMVYPSDFFNEVLGKNSRSPFNHIKSERDYSTYLSFLSASHLGGMFSAWPLNEERKVKPKASQQCPICNKIIMGAGKLPRHMRTHTGEKPYMCNICEVRFTRQDKLKIHMRKHTGERPYICMHCEATFVHNYDLKNHMRIHTGIRPYQCEYCYKSFTRSDHLHRHIKRQSCRISRPRRGRKPAAWRATSLLYVQDNQRDEKCFLQPTLEQRNGHLGVGDVGIPSPQNGHFLGDMRSAINLEDDLGQRFENTDVKLLERTNVETERSRGIYAYSLSQNESNPAQQYYPASEPWRMGLGSIASIPEHSN